MSARLLAHHRDDALVCFGVAGARTAAQLVRLALQVGEALPRVHEGQSVLLACRDRYFFIAGLLGALHAGFDVQLPPNGQAQTVQALSRANGVAALLHDVTGGDGIDIASLEQRAAAPRAQLLSAQLAERELVLFTSGSTGQPTAHRKLFGQLLAEANAHCIAFDLRGRRVVAGVPPHHIYGLLFSVLAPLLAGGSVLRNTPLFPRELCGELRVHDADVLVSVPPQLVALSEDHELPTPTLHQLFCSAGPLPLMANLGLVERGLTVTEVLGSTETGGVAYRQRPNASWQPLPGVAVSIASDDVLCVDAPWLSASQARPLRTADRAQATELGFRYLGRADAVTKIAGRRVDLGDVEACLRAIEGVRDARVLAVDGGGVRGLTLWAVVESAQDIPVASLRAALGRFDPVTHPKRFRCVRALPRTDSGKVTRSSLLALFDTFALDFESQPDGSVRVLVPRNTGFVRGHFEGDPILPGVVQLKNIALTELRRRFPELGAVARVTRVKFKRIVLPGETLTLTLSRKGPLQVQFAMQVGPEAACSGIFHFRDPDSAAPKSVRAPGEA